MQETTARSSAAHGVAARKDLDSALVHAGVAIHLHN